MTLLRRRKGEADDPAARAAEVDTVRRVLANYPPQSALSFGAPTRCPVCANYGLVLGLDAVHGGRSFNRCVTCGAEWMLTRRALAAARTAPVTVTGPAAPSVAAAWPPVAAAPTLDDAEAPAGVLFSRGDSGDVSRQVVALGAPRSATGGWAAAARPEPTPEPRRDGPMRILLVEDDPFDIEVVRTILEPVGEDTIDLRTARTRTEGEREARTNAPDLVLLDLGLPDSHGLATVTKWHFNHAAEAPVLVVSGAYGAEVVDRGRELGVTGFLDKAELADLLARGDEGTTEFLDRLTAAASR